MKSHTLHKDFEKKSLSLKKNQIYSWKVTLCSQKMIHSLQHENNSGEKFKDKVQENKSTLTTECNKDLTLPRKQNTGRILVSAETSLVNKERHINMKRVGHTIPTIPPWASCYLPSSFVTRSLLLLSTALCSFHGPGSYISPSPP